MNYKVRGVMPTTSLDDSQRDELLEQLAKDVNASSTADCNESRFRTWVYYHVRWFGDAQPVLPITEDAMVAIAAQFKHAGYRSFPNFMTAAKLRHCKEFPWPEELARCRNECIRSTQRGIGPARQCLEIPLRPLVEQPMNYEPLAPDGPICPREWAVLSSFHVLRGAESALALDQSLTLNVDKETETWRLPSSKTDPQGVGCARSWGCVCRKGEKELLCPFHAAKKLKQETRRRFADTDGNLPEGFPLFPNADGGWCSSKGFVATIEKMAALLNLSTIDELDRNIVGEHVWRITGSRHLAALDVPLIIIKLLARWGGDTVMRYVAEAPLSSLTQVYIDRVSASDDAARGLVSGLAAQPVMPIAQLTESSELDTCVDAAAQELIMDDPKQPFIVSAKGIVHLVSAPPVLGRATAMRTPCGWSFRDREHQLAAAVPAGARTCKMCGSDAVWTSVHALMSQLAAECTDSD